MTISIRRHRTRMHSPGPLAPERLAAWEEQVAALDGDALAARWVRADEWLLIRQLPLALRWHSDAVMTDVGRQWSQALTQAIEAALARDDGNCVRYRQRRAAWADLLYRSALRDSRRQWAWRRMGLIPRAPIACEDALRAAAVQLAREPELVWPVLTRLLEGEAQCASLTAALRGMPASLWQQLLSATPRCAPYAALAGSAQTGPHSPHSAALSTPPPRSLPTAAAVLLAWATARPHFAQRHRNTLTILLAALTWPPEGEAQSVLRERWASTCNLLAQVLPSPDAATSPAAVIQDPRAPPEPPPTQSASEPAATLPAAPELPEPGGWEDTCCGGALFWLGRFGSSGVLEALAQGTAPPDALRLLLRETARALGVPDDDAAMRAFYGGQVPQGVAPASLVDQAAALVQGWGSWLDQCAPSLAEPRIATVCGRAGRLHIEPGWIELQLPLAQVDTAIRRLGLDLTPGWLAWLGCAVRIRYGDE